MKLPAKIAIVMICILLCGAGAIVVSKTPEKCELKKTNTLPVKNRALPQRIWILA